MMNTLAIKPSQPFTSNWSMRMLAFAGAISVMLWILVPQMKAVDASVFSQLVSGFSELAPSRIGLQNASVPLTDLCRDFGLIAFSVVAIWGSYRVSSTVRLIIMFQLLALDFAYQWLCWQFVHVNGQPVSIASAIVAGVLAGRFLKLLDLEKQEMLARQIELNLRTRQLEESRIALVKQDEIERRLFAADLHDQVLNDLRSLLTKFENYAGRPDKVAEDSIRAQLKQTMSDVRGIMDDLCPIILSEFGLPAAIEDRLDRAAQEGGFEVRFNLAAERGELDALSDVERQLIYRLVQECINNARKHACASLLSVIITKEFDQLVVRINDDGKGVDLDKLNDSSRGTLYMRLRAAIIGAKIAWKPGAAGRGTTVEIRLTSRVRT